ncbi:MAG: M23 family metallopeptidase [Bacteroidales bacterium]|nr:M23 family metallopeptidase [Bacteroidales bacterium]
MKRQTKYILNNDLQYIAETNTLRQKLKKSLPSLIIGMFIAVISLFVVTRYIESPQVKRLKTKNDQLTYGLQVLNDEMIDVRKKLNYLASTEDSVYRVILGEKPVSSEIRESGLGGNINPLPNFTKYPEIVKKSANDLKDILAQTKTTNQTYVNTLILAKKNRNELNYIPAIMPIENKDLRRTGSGFGQRFHPILKIWRMHEGIDFIASTGTPVFATAQGTIARRRYSATFGKYVVVDHGNGIETYYAHLSGYNVKKGDIVKRGAVVGYVGNTGLSAGPHLHYEVHVNKKEMDPVNYFFNDLTPEQFEKIKLQANSISNALD